MATAGVDVLGVGKNDFGREGAEGSAAGPRGAPVARMVSAGVSNTHVPALTALLPRASPTLRSVNVLIPAWPAARRSGTTFTGGCTNVPPVHLTPGDCVHPSRVTSTGRAIPQPSLALLLSFVLFFCIKDNGMFAHYLLAMAAVPHSAWVAAEQARTCLHPRRVPEPGALLGHLPSVVP